MGYIARCTGKKGGRQRLAENRNTSSMMEHRGPVWKHICGPVTPASGRWLASRPIRSKKIFNSPNEPACYLSVTQRCDLADSLTCVSHSGRPTPRRRLAAYPAASHAHRSSSPSHMPGSPLPSWSFAMTPVPSATRSTEPNASVRIMLPTWEPPIGIEPMTYALREARSRPVQALAAPIEAAIALTALAVLVFPGAPFHESFHA
jgi:hypothetical protein